MSFWLIITANTNINCVSLWDYYVTYLFVTVAYFELSRGRFQDFQVLSRVRSVQRQKLQSKNTIKQKQF